MFTIILAAGRGSRLSLGDKSKFAYSIPFLLLNKKENVSFLDMNYDTFLVENSIKNLSMIRPNNFLFVLGYNFINVTPMLSYLSHKYGVKIDYVVNPYFNTTNTGYSLLLSLESLLFNNYLDDILILNGDIYLSSKLWKVIVPIVKERNFSFLVIDIAKKLNGESFKIKIENGKIRQMGKDLSLLESTGEFIGLSFIKREDVELFYSSLKNLVCSDKNAYYDSAFIDLSFKKDLKYLLIKEDLLWTEIDFLEDLTRLELIIKKDMEKSSISSSALIEFL